MQALWKTGLLDCTQAFCGIPVVVDPPPVGYAHALYRRLILFREKGAALHFDLLVHNVPEYENITDFKETTYDSPHSVDREISGTEMTQKPMKDETFRSFLPKACGSAELVAFFARHD